MREYMKLMEDMQDTGLQGNVDIKGLLQFLPEVNDEAKFKTAMNKVRQGQVERLNRLEMTQLALAFLSLLNDANEDRMKVVRKLATLKQK